MTDAQPEHHAHPAHEADHAAQLLLAAPVPPPPGYHGTERRADADMGVGEWREHVNRRLDEGAAKMQRLHIELKANTEATQAVASNTSELVTLFASFKGFFRVFELIGQLAKPLGAIVGLAVAGVAAYHSFFNGHK